MTHRPKDFAVSDGGVGSEERRVIAVAPPRTDHGREHLA